MRHKELLKFLAIVILAPICLWMLSLRGTVNMWFEYRSACRELAVRVDSVQHKCIANRPSVMEQVSHTKLKVVKYRRIATSDDIVTNELVVSGDFIETVKFINELQVSSVTITADNTTLIIQEI